MRNAKRGNDLKRHNLMSVPLRNERKRVWLECKGTRHQWSGPEAKAGRPDWGIDAWTVAMETDAIASPFA